MGLDMYLNKKWYVQNWDHMKDEEKHTITILKGGEPSNIQTDKIRYVITELLYWRKANAIHKWFVNKVQHGVDDCGDYYVSRENLQALLDVCKEVISSSELIDGKVYNGESWSKKNGHVVHWENGKVIKDSSVAEDLLPTQDGCFFGKTYYDQDYIDELVRTKESLEKELSLEDDEAIYEYYSSW